MPAMASCALPTNNDCKYENFSILDKLVLSCTEDLYMSQKGLHPVILPLKVLILSLGNLVLAWCGAAAAGVAVTGAMLVGTAGRVEAKTCSTFAIAANKSSLIRSESSISLSTSPGSI